MSKIFNLGFFRIFFVMIIVYGHMHHFLLQNFPEVQFFQNLFSHTPKAAYGYLCEAFFIMAGFFFFSYGGGGMPFLKLVLSKIARLWPVLAFCVFGFWILSANDMLYVDKYLNTLNLFMLPKVFGAFAYSYGEWFVHALFWGFIFYYLIFKLSPSQKECYVVGIITFLSYSVLINKMYLYEEPNMFANFLSYPLIRAIAGLGLGYLIGCLYHNYPLKKLEPFKYRLKDFEFWIFSAIEIVALIFLFRLSILRNEELALPMIIVLFIILFLSFIYKKGLLSRFFENKFFFDIGQYAYSIFLTQYISFSILNKIFFPNAIIGVEQMPVLNIFVCLTFTFLFGVLVYYFIEVPVGNFMMKRFTLLIEQKNPGECA